MKMMKNEQLVTSYNLCFAVISECFVLLFFRLVFKLVFVPSFTAMRIL